MLALGGAATRRPAAVAVTAEVGHVVQVAEVPQQLEPLAQPGAAEEAEEAVVAEVPRQLDALAGIPVGRLRAELIPGAVAGHWLGLFSPS